MSLSLEHQQNLYESGLTDETIELCQFRSARPHDIKRFKEVDSALVIPYFDLDGKPTNLKRLKFFPPLVHQDGRVQKYSQEQGSDSELYLPPLHPWKQIATDPTQLILITEGEKKAAAGCQVGLFCIGVAGVWNWRQRLDQHERMVIPAVDQFIWKDRPVLLTPDCDVWLTTKFNALCGYFALAMELKERGAVVQFIELPKSAQKKNGLDDWLCDQSGDKAQAFGYLKPFGLADPRFIKAMKWWQEWSEKQATRRAIHQHDADDLVLAECVGLFTVRTEKHGVEFAFDRLYEQRGAYHAELTVTCGATQLLEAVTISLKSDISQTALVKSLKLYATSIPWKFLLHKACALVLRRFRQGEPPAHLNRDSTVEALTYAVNPLVLRKKTTILFADGGKGKSTFALVLAMAVSTAQSVAGFSALSGKPLFLDWEDDVDVHTRRLHAIRAGHPELDAADVQYQRCCETLVKLTHELARTIQRESITFVIIDSLLAAMGGDSSADAVGKFFAALRVLQVESLLIGHTPKTLPEGQEHPTVYGSVFNQNFARGVWELKTEQELGDDSAILGLFHRKSNLTRKHLPIGLKVTQNQDGTSIKYEPFDLTKTAELINALPLPNRIRNLLDSDGTPRTSQQIADALGAKLGSVKTTLSRHVGIKWSLLGEGKDAKWTTISSPK